MLPRALILTAVAALSLAVATTAFTGARFTTQTVNAGSVLSADKTGAYVHAYSQSTNPGGLTGYAIRSGSSPSVPAATGADDPLAVNLGGYNNLFNTTANRVLTLTAPSTLPSGVSSVTVALSVAADPSTGIQPIADYTIATTSNLSLGKSVSFSAGVTRQVNLTVSTWNLSGNLQYVPRLVVKATYTGYSGNFLSYAIPVKIYDGSGPGPN